MNMSYTRRQLNTLNHAAFYFPSNPRHLMLAIDSPPPNLTSSPLEYTSFLGDGSLKDGKRLKSSTNSGGAVFRRNSISNGSCLSCAPRRRDSKGDFAAPSGNTPDAAVSALKRQSLRGQQRQGEAHESYVHQSIAKEKGGWKYHSVQYE